MIPLPPTRIQLGGDDITALFNAKKNWDNEQLKSPEQRPSTNEEVKNVQRKRQIEERIGMVKK